MIDTAKILAMTPKERRALVLRTAAAECRKFGGRPGAVPLSCFPMKARGEVRRVEIKRDLLAAIEVEPGATKKRLIEMTGAGERLIGLALVDAEAEGLVHSRRPRAGRSAFYHPGPSPVAGIAAE